MKSFALIIWLLTGNGGHEVIATQHVDSAATCAATAKVLVDQQTAQGKQVRFLCHAVVPEIAEVDENGNAVTPEYDTVKSVLAEGHSRKPSTSITNFTSSPIRGMP